MDVSSEFLKIKSITDNNSLLQFCQTKNNGKCELNEDEKKALAYRASKFIPSFKAKISVETIFELSILMFSKVDLSELKKELNRYQDFVCSIYSSMDFFDDKKNNFNNLKFRGSTYDY